MVKAHAQDNLRLRVEQVTDDTHVIHLSNGKNIVVVEKPEHNGNIWAWKVDSQYFSKTRYAKNYLERLVEEKMTGIRVISHDMRNVPDICGVEGRACRRPGECNLALCDSCPVAEAFFAKRDGVKLIYVAG